MFRALHRPRDAGHAVLHHAISEHLTPRNEFSDTIDTCRRGAQDGRRAL